MRKNIGVMLIVIAVTVSLIGITGFGYVLATVRVSRFVGRSMMPTIKDKEKVYYHTAFSELYRGDIIVFLYPKDQKKRYVKRIIGLPGEIVEIDGSKVFINGKQVSEEYLDQQYLPKHPYSITGYKIPSNRYYVLGDNRMNSSDSRAWGTLDISLIEGVVFSH